jgi:hypothetical protein
VSSTVFHAATTFTGEIRTNAVPSPAEKTTKPSFIDPLLTNRDFRFLWISNLFFFGGAWTQTLVLGWLVYESTHSEFAMAVFTAVRLAPLLPAC